MTRPGGNRGISFASIRRGQGRSRAFQPGDGPLAETTLIAYEEGSRCLSRMPSQLPPEPPREEPEIIPPDHEARAGRSGRLMDSWVAFSGGRTPNLLTTLLALLAFGIFAAGVLAMILGTFLLWLPVVIALILAMLASVFIRGFGRRDRR